MSGDNQRAPNWKKSSFSGMADCVEAARTERDKILVRDSKDPMGTVLHCTSAQWQTFIEAVKSGDLDF